MVFHTQSSVKAAGTSGKKAQYCSPILAGQLRRGPGSSNFWKERRARAKPGEKCHLAHEVNLWFVSTILTAIGFPSDELIGVRECLANGKNLRKKSPRANQEVDAKAERIIVAVLRGKRPTEELNCPSVWPKAAQYLRALHGKVFAPRESDTDRLKSAKQSVVQCIKAVIQLSLKKSPSSTRANYVLPRNSDARAIEVLENMAKAYTERKIQYKCRRALTSKKTLRVRARKTASKETAPTFDQDQNVELTHDHETTPAGTVGCTKTGRCFHKQDCQHWRQCIRFMSSAGARATGYRPCSKCIT